MNGKIVLSFLAGFAVASGVAFVLCRKKCRKNQAPHIEPKPNESAQPEPPPTETKPQKPLLGAQNPFATSPNPFGDPDPIIQIDPARSVEQPIRPDGFTYRDLFITFCSADDSFF